MGARARRWSWRVIGPALAAVVVVAGVYVAVRAVTEPEDTARLVELLRAFAGRWWAPLALVGAFVLVNLVGLPGTPLTIAAGAVWGWLAGGLWVMVATVIGSAAPFFLARSGFTGLKRRLEKRLEGVYEGFSEAGATTLVVMLLTHVVPFSLFGYAAGLAELRPRVFFLTIFLGALPGVFIYTYLADAILAGLVSPREASWRILSAGLLLAALVIGTRLVARRR